MQLFKRLVDSFKPIYKRNAFLKNYQAFPIFSDNLNEFDDSHETVQDLIDEYMAAEKENYTEWGNNMEMSEM